MTGLAIAGAFSLANVIQNLGLSTDGVQEHLAWVNDVNVMQNTVLEFPVVADADAALVWHLK